MRFAAHCVHWGYSWSVLAAVGPNLKQMVRWIAGRKSTEEQPGMWVVGPDPARTIMSFANGAALRVLSDPGPMPTPPDKKVFYFKVGDKSYRRLGP